MGFWQIFQKGGWIMYPLLLSSLASWCVIFEKWVTYRRFSRVSDRLFGELMTNLVKGRVEEARESCLKTQSTLVSQPILVYLSSSKPSPSREELEKRAERKVSHIHLELRRYLWVLATVSSSAPFIGLLGTVLGIIRSFSDIARLGKGGFSVVSAGISEALIATAAGILVAVIAVIFFNYYQVRLTHMMALYRNRLADLADVRERAGE